MVKLFTPDAAATWLLTELDPDEDDRAFAQDLYTAIMGAVGLVMAVAGIFAVPYMTSNSIADVIQRIMAGLYAGSANDVGPPSHSKCQRK